MLPFVTFAQILTWETGKKEIATWNYNEETHILSISGSGTLDKSYPTERLPIVNEVINSAKEIVIGEGFTSINIFKDGNNELENLERVVLPSSLWTKNENIVSAEIFNNCPKLQEVVFAEGTVAIYGFNNCDSIKSITIPSSVALFDAFGDCDSLRSVHISDLEAFCRMSNHNISSFHHSPLCNVVQHGVFDEKLNEYTIVMSKPRDLYLNGEKVVHLVIPNSITSLAPYIFAGCSAEKITLPKHGMKLGNCVFRGMTNIKSVEIPEGSDVGEALFEFCYSLKEITLNKKCSFGYLGLGMSLDNGVYTFSLCDSIENIILNEGVTELPSIFGRRYDREYSKQGIKTLELNSITIPSSLEHVGIMVNSDTCRFHNEKDWWQVSPSFVYRSPHLYIGNSPIEWPSGDVVIPDGVTRIMAGKFYSLYNNESENAKVTSIKIPNSVTSIGDFAFEGLTSVKEITLPENLEYIGRFAFNKMSSLENITAKSISPAQTEQETWGEDEGFYDTVRLYIPEGYKALYEELWAGFKEIIELNGSGIESVSVKEQQDIVIYNLNGHRINKVMVPGIYIVNGKKILTK